MILKAKIREWDAGISVVMLNRNIAKKIGILPQQTISIKTLSKKPKEAVAVVDIMEGELRDDQILLSSEVVSKLKVAKGQKVDINIASVPKSVNLIKRKLENKRLSKEEIDQIVIDIVNDKLSDAEIALFVAAMYRVGMDNRETVDFINAIIKTGSTLTLHNKFAVDKHSIGGVAGNRTTPIVVSICAAAGLTIPKTSSRAITSAAGTADVMETVAQIEFSIPDLKKILKKTGAFIVWGGGLGIVPADSKIIKVENALNIDPKSQLIASIMSKKFAFGSKYILIDIPYGKTAKIATKKKAGLLKRKFVTLGKYFNKKIKVVITDGSQPIGNGIGPALELMDILKILNPKTKGPQDLEKKSLFLAGNLLELCGRAHHGKGIEMAEKILRSGKAFEKFKQIIKAQKGSLSRIKYAKFKEDIHAPNTGKIAEIDNKKINHLARIAGSPVDKPAGLYLYSHVGDRVSRGDKLITIYSETKTRLHEAIKNFHETKPILIK